MSPKTVLELHATDGTLERSLEEQTQDVSTLADRNEQHKILPPPNAHLGLARAAQLSSQWPVEPFLPGQRPATKAAQPSPVPRPHK